MTPIHLVELSLDEDEVHATLAAMQRVLERGWFVLGPEVSAFEEELAESVGAAAAVGVGSGTDALVLGLRALGIGPGDEVVIPAFTAFPTAAAVLEVGATPVMVDVTDDVPLLDLDATLSQLTERTKAVVLVHLYGIVADAEAFERALTARGVELIEDCAQAQGGTLASGRAVGSAGRFGAYSFYPTKNLAAVGDGGAVVTSDLELADEVRSWRSHGERSVRYRHELPARNSRLDDLQAAVLRLRLGRLAADLDLKRSISNRYAAELAPSLRYSAHGATGAPHLAVVRCRGDELPGPIALASRLADHEIASGRHYPISLPHQPALQAHATAATPNADAWASECLSLPLHRRLTDRDVDRVIDATNDWLGTDTRR